MEEENTWDKGRKSNLGMEKPQCGISSGVSINSFDLKNKSSPLIYVGNAPNITGGYNSSISRFCLKNSLDENLVKGKIVLCDGFQGPSSLGFVSGAAGVLLRSAVPEDVTSIYALPTVQLGLRDGALIHSYINLTRIT
ncbi:Peptidase S8 [Vigna unguiculata]|uniref:Peptidase S8 n=1 Tax=Vigna unguiculata TaxID=3917 RepID=A0A4D6MXY1_VIGUN|nr:Peptidase S8 [Vigna unguiculata]